MTKPNKYAHMSKDHYKKRDAKKEPSSHPNSSPKLDPEGIKEAQLRKHGEQRGEESSEEEGTLSPTVEAQDGQDGHVKQATEKDDAPQKASVEGTTEGTTGNVQRNPSVAPNGNPEVYDFLPLVTADLKDQDVSTVQINDVEAEIIASHNGSLPIGTRVRQVVAATPKDYYGPMAIIELPRHKYYGQKFHPENTTNGTSIYHAISPNMKCIMRRAKFVFVVFTDMYLRILLINIEPLLNEYATTEFNPSRVTVFNKIAPKNTVSFADLGINPTPFMKISFPIEDEDKPYEAPEFLQGATKKKPLGSKEKFEKLKTMSGFTDNSWKVEKNHGKQQAVTTLVHFTPTNVEIVVNELGGIWHDPKTFTDDKIAAQRGQVKFDRDTHLGNAISWANCIQRQRPEMEAYLCNFGIRFKIAKKVDYQVINDLKAMFMKNLKIQVFAEVKPEPTKPSGPAGFKQDASKLKEKNIESTDNCVVLIPVNATCIQTELVKAIEKTYSMTTETTSIDRTIFRCKTVEQAEGMHQQAFGAGTQFMLVLYKYWKKHVN